MGSEQLESKAEAVFISAGCNRSPKALDWGGRQNQLIYGQCRSIALLSRQEPFQVKCSLNKHTDVINCVKWIASSGGLIESSQFTQNEFVSASKDKSVIVWQGHDEEVKLQLIVKTPVN
jgi:hypothetical protein